jgi:hypothetical protein
MFSIVCIEEDTVVSHTGCWFFCIICDRIARNVKRYCKLVIHNKRAITSVSCVHPRCLFMLQPQRVIFVRREDWTFTFLCKICKDISDTTAMWGVKKTKPEMLWGATLISFKSLQVCDRCGVQIALCLKHHFGDVYQVILKHLFG